MEMKWGNPPARKTRAKHDWPAIASALQARPGEWAMVAEDVPSSTAGQIKHGILRDFRPAGAYETQVTGVNRENGRARELYVRYLEPGDLS